MNVQVKLFAVAKQLAQRDTVLVQVAEPATVAGLRRALADQIPALGQLAAHVMFAVDADYADDETEIPDGAEVACIPPVSGG